MKTVKDFHVRGKKVLVRCDFNVPLDDRGNILDNFRIMKTLPTINYLKERGAMIILMSHLGRPQEVENEKLRREKFSLKPVSLELSKMVDAKVKFLPDCIGDDIRKETEKMKVGEIILLENLRFYKKEKENNSEFAKNIASLGDIYINDSFGSCHRTHASIVGITKYLPAGIGLLAEKEIKILTKVFKKTWSPLVIIIGGVKIATKIKTIEQFLKKADHLLLGGEIANVFLRAKGVCLGKILSEEETVKRIKQISLTNSKLHLPIDAIISLEDIEAGLKEGYIRKAAPGLVRKEEDIYDIGPETIKIFSKIIKTAKMIVWNGPLGVYEKEPFEKGTKEIAEVVVRNYSAFKIAGGGDTISALKKFDLQEKFDHISTGGGVMLDFLAGEKLPGLEAIKR
jgi:3-phosphoglycerate kinase